MSFLIFFSRSFLEAAIWFNLLSSYLCSLIRIYFCSWSSCILRFSAPPLSIMSLSFFYSRSFWSLLYFSSSIICYFCIARVLFLSASFCNSASFWSRLFYSILSLDWSLPIIFFSSSLKFLISISLSYLANSALCFIWLCIFIY